MVALRARRRAELELRRVEEERVVAEAASRHCSITGLANRQSAEEWLGAALATPESRPAVIWAGFVPFAPGGEREAGLARAVAKTLAKAVPGERLVARMDAGQYVLAFDGSAGSAALVSWARSACSSLARLVADTQRLRVGVALAVGDDTPVSLIERAQQAFERCAGDGRVALSVADTELQEEIRQRTYAAEELASAIVMGRVEPFFQPFVELGTGRVLGFEVLARWREEGGRVRLPGEFLTLAEESGLVGPMYDALLRAAVEEARSWPAEWSLAVNLSPEQIGDSDLVERTIRILRSAGIGPKRLEIEIAEHALERDLDAARALVGELRAHGIRVTLDNFGSGRLHLSELASFRFDCIKVSPAVVEGRSGADAGTALGLIAAAARHLGVPVLVQGIETHAGAAAAQVQGCAVGQGYLFGRPDPHTECFRLDGALARAATR